jgi:hypothetical protein
MVLSCLMVAAASAHAGQTKPNVVRIAKQQTQFGPGFTFGQTFRPHRFKPRRFDELDLRPSFVTFRHHRHRHRHVPISYYDYDHAYGYRDEPRYQPGYRPEASVASPAKQYGPVTPKWVHVGGGDGASGRSGAEGAYAEAGPGTNCLTVKTEITVDGTPMDAFGKACLLADGTWQLRPAEAND